MHAVGEIEAETLQALHDIETEAASGASRVVIDLAHVTFVDPSDLGALIAARQSARESGGSLVLVSPPAAGVLGHAEVGAETTATPGTGGRGGAPRVSFGSIADLTGETQPAT